MHSIVHRLTPVAILTALLLAASSVQAHAIDDLVTCIWEGPTGGC